MRGFDAGLAYGPPPRCLLVAPVPARWKREAAPADRAAAARQQKAPRTLIIATRCINIVCCDILRIIERAQQISPFPRAPRRVCGGPGAAQERRDRRRSRV